MKLNVLLFTICISVVIAIYLQLTGHSYFGTLKAITTILIILIPLSLSENIDKPFAKVMIVGLVFCLVGDIVLLEEARFVYGLLAFLIAHLLFCYGFYFKNKQRIKFISLIPYALIGISYFMFLHSSLGAIAIPVAVYISVIVFMSWLATELYFSSKNKSHLAILIGAILFLISDSTLAFNKFIGEFNYSSIMILGTYWLAITLFAYSTVAAVKKVNS